MTIDEMANSVVQEYLNLNGPDSLPLQVVPDAMEDGDNGIRVFCEAFYRAIKDLQAQYRAVNSGSLERLSLDTCMRYIACGTQVQQISQENPELLEKIQKQMRFLFQMG